MDKEKCIQAGIDYDSGLARFMGHSDLYEKYLGKFLEDDSYSQLETAMATGDVQASFQAAHSLKGVAGNLSLMDLYNAVVPFVDALRGEGNMELARTLYPPVQKEYARITSFLKENR